MKKNHKRIGNKTLCASLALGYLVLVTTSMVSGLMARYVTQSQETDQARVAAFVFAVTEPSGDGAVYFPELSEIQKPGDSVTYLFHIQNFRDGGAVCEVEQDYVLKMTENGSLPLSYTLTMVKDVQGNTVSTPSVSITASGVEQSVSCEGTFQASVEQSTTWELEIVWPKTENSPEYAAGTGLSELQLSVVSAQVD